MEFPIVFIVGLNDGVLPHSRSFEDPEAMQEERRLLYVGITRAKDRLYLLYSQNRSMFGFSEPAGPSRYLDDIPVQLLDVNEPAPVRRPPATADYRWEKPTQAASAVYNTATIHSGYARLPPGLAGRAGAQQPHARTATKR